MPTKCQQIKVAHVYSITSNHRAILYRHGDTVSLFGMLHASSNKKDECTRPTDQELVGLLHIRMEDISFSPTWWQHSTLVHESTSWPPF